jgi:hypothetical protein
MLRIEANDEAALGRRRDLHASCCDSVRAFDTHLHLTEFAITDGDDRIALSASVEVRISKRKPTFYEQVTSVKDCSLFFPS